MAPRTFHIALHSNDRAGALSLLDELAIEADNLGITTQKTDVAINAARQKRAAQLGLEQARPGGLGDTGRQVEFCLQEGMPPTTRLTNVKVSGLVAHAIRNRYKLLQPTRARKPVYDQRTGQLIPGQSKWVIRFVFTLEEDEQAIHFSSDVFEQRLTAFFQDTVFEMCVVWENDTADTINLTRVQTGRPRRIYRLRFTPEGGYAVDVEPR